MRDLSREDVERLANDCATFRETMPEGEPGYDALLDLVQRSEPALRALRDRLDHAEAEVAAAHDLLRSGADLLSVESEALKCGIRIGTDGDLSTATEDAHTVQAIEEIERWIASAAAAIREGK